MAQVFPFDMTTDSAPSPFVAAASSEDSTPTHAAFKAFDGIESSLWMSIPATGWLSIDLGAGNAVAVQSYLLRTDQANPNRAPKNWTFEGSNNGSTWTTLDTQTNQTSWTSVPKFYSFSNSTAYRYYRLNVSANNGDAQLNVVSLYGYTTTTSPVSSYFGKLPECTYFNNLKCPPPFIGGSGGPVTPVPVAGVLHDGVIGIAYSETIGAQGGTSPYTFSLLSGSLPTGTSLNTSTGVISGTPSAIGTFSFTIKAVDALGNYGTTNFSIAVAAAPSAGGGAYVWLA